jgi:hypothetical protein
MTNPIKQRPLEPILAELVQMGAHPNGALFIGMRDMFTRSDKTVTNNGEIQAQAPVTGRTEGVGTTVGNISASGIAQAPMVDFSISYVNKNVGNIPETSNLKYRTTAHSAAQPTNIVITGTDTGAGHASASYPSFNLRVPTSDGLFVDITEPPGLALGLLNSTTYYCFIDDANFNGTGTMTVTTDPNNIFQSGSRVYAGTVTTPAALGAPTTGKPGGMGGGVNRATVLS